MTFKEFFQLQELESQLGNVKQVKSLLGIHRMEKRLHIPAQKKGTTSVSRAMAAGKINSPSRPVSITSPNKPLVLPSVLK